MGVKLDLWVERRNENTVVKENLMEMIDSFGDVINNACIFNYIYMLFLVCDIFELLLCVRH